MKRKNFNNVASYPGDMTSWMFEENPRYDYHLLQFLKRYELDCQNQESYLCSKEKDKSKEFAFT